MLWKSAFEKSAVCWRSSLFCLTMLPNRPLSAEKPLSEMFRWKYSDRKSAGEAIIRVNIHARSKINKREEMNKLFPIFVRVSSVMVFNANRVACSVPRIIAAGSFLFEQQNKQVVKCQFDFWVAIEALDVFVRG